MTDTELVARACGGEISAFDELVRRHHRVLYRTALAIVRSPADAEDVTQDAWLQVYRNIGRYRGAASVVTWLVAIVRNHAIDCRRATFRRLTREAEHSHSYTPNVSPEDMMLVNERRARPRVRSIGFRRRCAAHCGCGTAAVTAMQRSRKSPALA
jgi:RNA polymerase sigma factor (sigma-70 family)